MRAGERELPIDVRGPELLYRESSFEAEIAVPSFVDAPHIESEIRLLGLDSTWHHNDDEKVHYGFLDPGAYELQARARRPHGAWGAPATFPFTVVPPWWRTWWLRAGAALALAGIVALLTRRKQAELRRHNEQLATLVELRTRALGEAHERMVKLEKDATESQMAGGFAHEMRNALTGAKILLRSVGMHEIGEDDGRGRARQDEASKEALRARVHALDVPGAVEDDRGERLLLGENVVEGATDVGHGGGVERGLAVHGGEAGSTKEEVALAEGEVEGVREDKSHLAARTGGIRSTNRPYLSLAAPRVDDEPTSPGARDRDASRGP